jgi:hypothetical protein
VAVSSSRFGAIPDPTVPVVDPGQRVELQRVAEDHYVLPDGVI